MKKFDKNFEPQVAILMAAHNEEKVLEKKLESILQSSYPQNKIQVFIGSDCSTDATNEILQKYAEKFSNIHFFAFENRQGKPAILNQLVKKTNAEFLILTDANVFFDTHLISNLVRNFEDKKIGLVGADIINTGLKKDGISVQEDSYIKGETQLKYREGNIFGTMMGPFGACFAMRKSCYATIPDGFIVDDFYLCMKVYEQSFKGIVDLEAKCFEDVSNQPKEEFRRKKRISIGNFQNLKTFQKFIFHKNLGLSFCFVSHKVLRWFGAYFLILAYFSNLFLMCFENDSSMFSLLFIFQTLFYIGYFLDKILSKINIHIAFLRLISHFIAMNTALLLGHFAFLSKNYNTVWKPTERNQ